MTVTMGKRMRQSNRSDLTYSDTSGRESPLAQRHAGPVGVMIRYFAVDLSKKRIFVYVSSCVLSNLVRFS